MPLSIQHSFDEKFCTLLEALRKKYPEELFLLEGIHTKNLDINQASKSFFCHTNSQSQENTTTADTSIDPNANVAGHDVITFNYEVPKPIMKLNSLYNLWLMIYKKHGLSLANNIIEAALSGDVYINDAWDIGRPYCFNFSTLDIAQKGLPVAGRLNITPPKSLSAFLHQTEQFTVTAANMTLGATGLADLLIVASLYVDKILATGKDHNIPVCGTPLDSESFQKDVERYIEEQFIHLIYTFNYEFRGNQSPFTNISIYDDAFLQQLIPSYTLPNSDKTPSRTTVKRLQNIFLRVFNKELERNPLTFPVVTACFSTRINKQTGERIIQDKNFLDMIAEANMKFGFINIYCGETSTLSSCCRLRSNTSDLGYTNTFGSGSTKIGSLGVVTINLPRIALSNVNTTDNTVDFTEFLNTVRLLVYVCGIINNAKREFIKDRIKRNALPLYDYGFMSLKNQYSTCGFTGLWEALNIMGFNITERSGLEAATEILETINAANVLLASKFGTPHNMEQVPAESSAVKLAKKDELLALYKISHTPAPTLYSNQFVPLWEEDADLLDRITIQGKLDSLCTGGAICHLNVAQAISHKQALKALIEHACTQGVVYFAINYYINKCLKNHMTVGLHTKVCPICSTPITDTYTRVVGFLTNTKQWNKARREEDLPNRVFIPNLTTTTAVKITTTTSRRRNTSV